jgi:phosphinothricin acetyltransferase
MGRYAASVDISIRPARVDDLVRINEIYNTTIVDSHVSFDMEPWDLERRLVWWERYDAAGPSRALVAETDGTVIGVAYSNPYRPKEAYRSSAETTIVLDLDHLGVGIGRQLLTALLDSLRADGVHRAYAIVALPNDASIGLHESLGFRAVGTLDEAGCKLGQYWSTTILERRLD